MALKAIEIMPNVIAILESRLEMNEKTRKKNSNDSQRRELDMPRCTLSMAVISPSMASGIGDTNTVCGNRYP